MKIYVKIMPKEGVLDPQGKAIENSLKQLGFADVQEARQGKIVELNLDIKNEEDALALTREMSERLLANMVIEDFEISIIKDDL
ncbi:MAG: phosphoribosylformylglycinamidine synthase [Rhodobiaceae bacterium]|nr:phosphoribosylformylglycinamidine synthase [Rhodobiaceae bacterium]|tara:strand:+ start:911 stop:1162 length:252 start_codon:yes stop_codon:yes gene_type:complete